MRFASTVVLFVIGVVLFSPLALAAPITATPDKATYNPGDILVVSGTATPSSAVTVKVNNPSDALVGIQQGNTDAAGAYSITVFTWPSAAGGNKPLGTYTIIATDAANGDTTQTTVEFAEATTTTTTTTATNTTVTTTVTSTVTSTSTTTSRTTVTTTTTATTTSRVTSTTTSTTTRTSTTTAVSTQTRTVTSTATATTTTTAVSTTTATSTVISTAAPSTTTVTEEVPVGMPAEVTYAAVAVAVVAIIAAAVLVTRKRA